VTPTAEEPPAHCLTKDEWPHYDYVAEQKVAVFKPDRRGRPSVHIEFADRVDYLESVCTGINAYRGGDD
jgi:hypothetical protein